VRVFHAVHPAFKTISCVFTWLYSYQTMEYAGGRGRQYKVPEDCFELPTKPIRLQDLPHPSQLWLLFTFFLRVHINCQEFHMEL